jgi:hypothetical protein
MPEDHNQASGDATSQTGSSAVQRGGAGAEKTPADSDTPQNTSGSSVGLNGPLNSALYCLGFADLSTVTGYCSIYAV